MEPRKQIELSNGIIKGEYEVENNFAMKIWMTEPYSIFVRSELKAGTFKNDKNIEDLVSSELNYLYYCAEVIKCDLSEFEKLSVSYSSCESGWHIKLFNKVFYSSYEEDRFRKEMKESLKENYSRMYDEYIKSPEPIYRIFKDKLTPSILSILIKSIKEKEEEI